MARAAPAGPTVTAAAIGRAAVRAVAVAAALASLVLRPASAQTWPTSSSGAVREVFFQSTRTLDDLGPIYGASVQFKASLRPTDHAVLKFEARAGNVTGRPGHADLQLVEAYAGLRRARWDLRFGKQIIAWGRADGINPTDLLGPRDYTVLLPFDEDQRLGIWAISASYAWAPELALHLIWKLDAEPSTVPIPSADRSAYRFVEPHRRAAQLGLRLNRAGGDLDWSLSLFHGRSLLPEAGAVQGDAGTPLRLSYPLITMIGADLAKNFSSFGTRAELAYVVPARSAAEDQPGLRRNLYVVAGIDHTFEPRLNVNLQLFVRRAWGLPGSDLAPRPAAAQTFDASTFMQQRSRVAGATMRVSNSWLHETLRAEVFVQRYFLDGDILVQPMLSYAWSDAVRMTLGGQYFAGHGLQLGALKRNRGLFAEIRYSF